MIPENTLYNSPKVEQATMNGVDYPSALVMYSTKEVRKLEINAGRRQKRFRGSLSIPDNQASDSAHQVDISLDGANPIYSALVKFGETKEIDLDVTNVLRVRISVASVGKREGTVGIGTARFD